MKISVQVVTAFNPSKYLWPRPPQNEERSTLWHLFGVWELSTGNRSPFGDGMTGEIQSASPLADNVRVYKRRPGEEINIARNEKPAIELSFLVGGCFFLVGFVVSFMPKILVMPEPTLDSD